MQLKSTLSSLLLISILPYITASPLAEPSSPEESATVSIHEIGFDEPPPPGAITPAAPFAAPPPDAAAEAAAEAAALAAEVEAQGGR